MGKIKKYIEKSLLSLLCTVALSCAHSDPETARGCTECDHKKANVSKVATPVSKSKSMVLIVGTVFQGENYLGEWTGSGAIVGHHETHGTMILTAGHVCVLQSRPPTASGDDPIVWKLDVLDRKEIKYPAKSAFVAENFDACLINTDSIDMPDLQFSDSPPIEGESVFNISSPYGMFSREFSLIFQGFFAGVLTKGSENPTLGVIPEDVSFFAIPSAPGSSGSPLLNLEGKIIGIVSRVHGRFHHLVVSPHYNQLEALFAGKANVKNYDF